MVTFDGAKVRRLSRQRGAAVFIVVMVLTLLTAVGVFAVRSASLADVAAGFDREGAQVNLVAQYGVTAAAAMLSTGIARDIIGTMTVKAAGNPYVMPYCESNGLAPGATPPSPLPKLSCYRIPQSELDVSFARNSNASTFAPTNRALSGRTSSLNVNETTDARFTVELTDPVATGVPLRGTDPSILAQYRVILTSMAQVRPFAACSNGTTTPTAAQTAMRSVITVAGPPTKL